ncbi:hypothetical protein TrVE_jg2349 [Triparma verrucosa]|uniref:EGF-like domain-containing protein n=1 Tax=Triparma verrucosa TaxID=1606542 RepID=A0A9W7FEG5_9STRA|nr:hypothetical protein TrVE_jg2349 [Triparma verrucosa]
MAGNPSITRYESFSQVENVARSERNSVGGTVIYLGTFDDEAECSDACLAATTGSTRCNYYTYFPSGASIESRSLSKQCFEITSPGFNPSYDETAVTGAVHWGCRDDSDCSLNGKCSESSTCQCRPAWKGERCETLNILPTPKESGYRRMDLNQATKKMANTSSWGGAILPDPKDGTLHMWASEMTEHCGIGAWAQNSRIIHAVAESADKPFERKDVVWDVFSHEPEVVPGSDGEFVMYFTAQLRGEHGDCDCCRDGEGPCDGSTGPGDCGDDGTKTAQNLGDSDPTWMSFTTDPSGNWSEPVQIFSDYQGSDTNFAPVILKNGSMVAMWRSWTASGGSRMFLSTGSDWKDPSTYIRHTTELFPDLGAAGTEDQFIYLDNNGNYHAIFHHMYGTGTKDQWWLDATGGHAFSVNGWDWTYTGVTYGDPLARYDTDIGQGASIDFDDGTTYKFTRLERPHLLFYNVGELKGDPTHIINSAQYGRGTDPGTGANNDDACYTLVRPINVE